MNQGARSSEYLFCETNPKRRPSVSLGIDLSKQTQIALVSRLLAPDCLCKTKPISRLFNQKSKVCQKTNPNVTPNPLAGEGPMDKFSSNENTKQSQS
jgi:hypothetical protein